LIGIATIALDPDQQLPESDWPLRDGHPPESKIIHEYVNKFLDYERLREHSQDLVDAVEFILQILAATAIEEQTIISSQPMRERIAFMRSKCAKLNKLVSRIIDRRDQRYDLFVKNLNIDDSVSVKRLTILAAVFLPCSLACSIVSMQTRFVELHLLLYAFLGGFILVASLAVVIYLILQAFTQLSRRDRSWINQV
jgi:Mg2+ and Co2+ transporter CorA